MRTASADGTAFAEMHLPKRTFRGLSTIMTLRLRPFLTRILALLASVLLALAPVNAKPAPGEYQRISSALFAGILENSGAEGVCFSTRREEIQADLRTIGIVNFVAPSTWEGLALELFGAGAGKVLSLGGKTFIKIGDDFVEVADDFAANRIVPDEFLDQVDLDRFANLRNDLGITSNNQLRRNVAVGEGYVDGADIGEIIGVSGWRGPGVEMPENPIFTTTTVGHPRDLDSEVFVLETLAQRLTPQSTGTIRLLSERTVCASCEGVITQFREMFPNINLIVRSGAQ